MSEPKPGQVFGPGGAVFMADAKGALWPIEVVKKQDLLRDELVRALFAQAEEEAARLKAFKARAFADVDSFLDLVAEQYGTQLKGDKGNVSLTSYDGSLRILVQIADVISFKSAELQACKAIVDELIAEWSVDSQAELRAIVMNAFRVDKAGQINRGALLGLLRLEISEPRWVKAMAALKDSITIDGTKAYIRFSKREGRDAAWQNLSLDLATA